MRLRKALLAFALAVPTILAAQAPADEIARLEQQRLEAQRAGRGLERFYSRTYRGITATGQPETFEQIQSPHQPNPSYARHHDVAVELHAATAIVTGTEGNADAGDRDRVLRIWTKDNGTWKIVAAQTTWVGNRTGVPPPIPALSTPTEAFVPRGAVEEALWTSQDALMRSFSNADPAAYTMFSTENSRRLTTAGDVIARDQWLDTTARRAKGPLAVVDEVRITAYGEVGVVTLRGHEASPTRQSWIYLKQDGIWKLHLRYTTLIRS